MYQTLLIGDPTVEMAPRISVRARLGTPGRPNTPDMAVGLRNTSSTIFNSNFFLN